MIPLASVVLFVLVGYVLGSTPSAYLMSCLFGRGDIRAVGSGNVGGMNAFRNVHPLAGLLTGLFDVLKGSAAVWAAQTWGSYPGTPDWLPLLAAAAAVMGHNYMLFLGFRGGKGLGTTVGALLVLWPAGILWLLGAIATGSIVLRDTNTDLHGVDTLRFGSGTHYLLQTRR